MAVVFPSGIEVYANCPACIASGSSGTSNPGAGSTESWTMSTGYTSFPAASTSVTPNTFFYIRDPADTSNEIVLVSAGGGGTSSWSVQRGMNGATVAHATGATWQQVISPYTLQNYRQTSGAPTSAVTVSTANETILASYQPVTADLVAGAAFDAIAYGPVGPQHIAAPTLEFSLYWGGSGSVGGTYTTTGGVLLARILTNQNIPALGSTISAGASFDLTGDIAYISSTAAHGSMNLWLSGATITTAAVVGTTTNTSSSTGQSQSGPVTISGTGPIFLTAKWSTVGGSQTLTAVAPFIRRAV